MDNKKTRIKEIKKVIKRTRIIKTISWRLIAWSFTTFLTWLFIGDVGIAISIGSIDVTIKLVGFYIHDTAWAKYADRKIREIKKKYPKL